MLMPSHARTHACPRTRERVTYGFVIRSSALNPTAHAGWKRVVHNLCTAEGGLLPSSSTLYARAFYVARCDAWACQPVSASAWETAWCASSAGFSGSPSSPPSLPAGACTSRRSVHRRRQRRLLRQLRRRRARGRNAGPDHRGLRRLHRDPAGWQPLPRSRVARSVGVEDFLSFGRAARFTLALGACREQGCTCEPEIALWTLSRSD
jgi:hypothetical protein